MTTMTSVETTVYASAARTATPTASTLTAHGRQRLYLVIDVTAGAAGFSVTPTIDGYDSISGKWWTVLTGAAIAGTGTTVLKIGPGLTPAANVCVADVLPSAWRVVMTHADAKSITYSVAAKLHP
jgi:hypothetical protein